jgi:SAM-dependent methyltransferase
VYGIDLFDEMLEHARSNLSGFGDRVTLRRGDFCTMPLGSGYHVCVSALSMHHLRPPAKGELLRRIHDALSPGGRFIMIDWTRFTDRSMQERAFRVAEKHVSDAIDRADVVRDWCEHWRLKNIPDTVEDLLAWFKSAGFESSECLVRYYGMALLIGEKSQ